MAQPTTKMTPTPKMNPALKMTPLRQLTASLMTSESDEERRWTASRLREVALKAKADGDVEEIWTMASKVARLMEELAETTPENNADVGTTQYHLSLGERLAKILFGCVLISLFICRCIRPFVGPSVRPAFCETWISESFFCYKWTYRMFESVTRLHSGK